MTEPKLTVKESFWIAGDNQPCPAVEVWDGDDHLVFQKNFMAPEEEQLFLECIRARTLAKNVCYECGKPGRLRTGTGPQSGRWTHQRCEY